MKSLVATGPFKYGTRMLTAGDLFSCGRRNARVLVAIGKAKEAPKVVEPETPKKKRRSSRRKKSDE